MGANKRVRETYTWRQTAERYLSAIDDIGCSDGLREPISLSGQLDETARI